MPSATIHEDALFGPRGAGRRELAFQVVDVAKKAFRRLLEQPLLQLSGGEGELNDAGPVRRGPSRLVAPQLHYEGDQESKDSRMCGMVPLPVSRERTSDSR